MNEQTQTRQSLHELNSENGLEENPRPKQILIVDDEKKFCEFFQRVFTKKGFVVFTAANNFDACILLAAQQIDLVILDLNLARLYDAPLDFMSAFRIKSGSTLFDLMKMFHKHVKVIVASAYTVSEQKERISGADGYFDKSESKDALVKMVSLFLQDPQTA